MGLNKIPMSEYIDIFVDWLTNSFSGLFKFIQVSGQNLMDVIADLLLSVNPLIFILVIAVLAYFVSNKKFGLSIFSVVGLLFVYNQELWNELINTLTLVIVSSIIAVLIGIPLGILMSKRDSARSIITPILDFMQTMPGFVYLLPAVAFFGIGIVPGVFASIIFALPPTVRLTNLGIRQVSKELVEAADSFGSTPVQKLIKVELPLAKPTIMAGINQTVMLSLSMVVIASMIGAPGLGRVVLSALQRAQIGDGFVAGISLVILAIIIDRFTQYLNKERIR